MPLTILKLPVEIGSFNQATKGNPFGGCYTNNQIWSQIVWRRAVQNRLTQVGKTYRESLKHLLLVLVKRWFNYCFRKRQ